MAAMRCDSPSSPSSFFSASACPKWGLGTCIGVGSAPCSPSSPSSFSSFSSSSPGTSHPDPSARHIRDEAVGGFLNDSAH